MGSSSYLIFSLGNLNYGLDTSWVREIFPLPELTPMPETPYDVIGVLNLRGEVLPVMHLARRLGYAPGPCKLSDSLIVVEWQTLKIGIVVHAVTDVRVITPAEINQEPDYGRTNNHNRAFVAGIARFAGDLVTLLNPDTLLRQPDVLEQLVERNRALDQAPQELAATPSPEFLPDPDPNPGLDAVDLASSSLTPEIAAEWSALVADASDPDQDELESGPTTDIFAADTWEESAVLRGMTPDPPTDTEVDIAASIRANTVPEQAPPSLFEPELQPGLFEHPLGSFYELYCPESTEVERQIFRHRAESLGQPLTVGELNPATASLSLAIVSLNDEYFGLDLTLVKEFIDVQALTPIPCCPSQILGNMNLRGEITTLVDIRQALGLTTDRPALQKAMIVEAAEIVAGIAIDQVLDITYLPSEQIAPIPSTLPQGRTNFFKGTTRYGDQLLSILDLANILASPAIVVDEAVA
ncbi:MAG: chemotaxis protein CheW [Cyanobacteria bacterium P01_H01_bin.121]